MSTTLPHGIIQINEGNISWYGDITANWQLIDSKIGEYDAAIAAIPAPANTGTLTINYGGATIAMFGADDAGNVSADIPAPGDGTLTIQQNGTTVDTFTANSSSDTTVNIQCVDLTSNQTVPGNKEFTGTTTAHDLVPSATDTYNFGSPSYQWNNAYIKSLTINGVACGDILTHDASEFVDVSSNQTVGGVKKFSDGLFASKSGQGDLATLEDSSINSTNEDANGMPLAGHTISFKIKGSQFNVIPCMLTGQVFTSGNTSASLRVYKYKDTSKRADIQITYVYATDRAEAQFTNCHITTNVSGVYDIGSSTNKWKDVNTVLLNGKTPAYSTDIPTKVSQLTNDSGFITSENALPVGSYIQFAGSQAPDGFLVCNGGEISRTTYSALFAVIGTTYGSGDGSTTFNLPNLTDRFLQGSSTSGTVKNAGLPNITGDDLFLYGNAALPKGSGALNASIHSGYYTPASGNNYADYLVTFDASLSNSIYGNSSTVQPPALTCLICIKY